MKHRGMFLSIALLLLAVSTPGSKASDNCYSDAWGKEFFIGIPAVRVLDPHYPIGDISLSYIPKLTILAREAGHVTVTTARNYSQVLPSVGGNDRQTTIYNVTEGYTTVHLSNALMHLSPNSLKTKGVKISSPNDVSLLLTVALAASNSFASMLLLPVSVLSREYIVPYSGDFGALLVGIGDSTTFNAKCGILEARGKLGELQTYFIKGVQFSDQISCIISSDKPIAVFMSKVTSKLEGLEQAIPVSAWGQKYVVPSYPPLGQSFQIFVSQNDTYINTDQSPVISVHADRGELRQSNSYSSSLTLNSNKPIMVVHYGDGYDDFMTTVPSVSQFSNAYTFFVPDINFHHFVTVIVESAKHDAIVLNEVNIPAWKSISKVTVNGVQYSIATFQVQTTGLHRLSLRSAGDVFGGFVFGYFDENTNDYAYAHPLGLTLKTQNPGCSYSQRRIGKSRPSSYTKSRASSVFSLNFVHLFCTTLIYTFLKHSAAL